MSKRGVDPVVYDGQFELHQVEEMGSEAAGGQGPNRLGGVAIDVGDQFRGSSRSVSAKGVEDAIFAHISVFQVVVQQLLGRRNRSPVCGQ